MTEEEIEQAAEEQTYNHEQNASFKKGAKWGVQQEKKRAEGLAKSLKRSAIHLHQCYLYIWSRSRKRNRGDGDMQFAVHNYVRQAQEALKAYQGCTKCGHIILADTEDWDEPLCHGCYEDSKKGVGDE